MKIFQSVQAYFAQLGISPQSQSVKRHSFDMKNVMIFVSIAGAFVVCSLFLVFEANDFKEYSNCFFSTITFLMGIFDYAIHVWKMKELFHFIKKFEHFIQRSKYSLFVIIFFYSKFSSFSPLLLLFHLGLIKSNAKEIYEKSNERIEKWSKIMYSVMMKITLPIMMVSMPMIGYVMYFTTDLGDEAFQLLSFAWLDCFVCFTALSYTIFFRKHNF